MRRRPRPRKIIANFRGIDYEMDLRVCDLALVRRQVEGDFDSMEALAQAAGCSRSTASRFFSGRQTSLSVALTMLEQLKLRFDEVFTPCEPGGGPAMPPRRT